MERHEMIETETFTVALSDEFGPGHPFVVTHKQTGVKFGLSQDALNRWLMGQLRKIF
jgi:hypothetical protein